MKYKDLIGGAINDKIKIYNCDNMELLRQTPDNYYSLSICDPPYGIGDKFKGGKSGKMNFNEVVDKGWDSEIPSAKYFEELKRVSKNQIIWGGNYFLDYLNNTRCILTWDKIQEFSGSDFEMAWTSFDKVSKTFRMSRVEAYGKGTIHPTQKPVKLYEWLLINYAKEGDKILDTHGGSMSIALAVHNVNSQNNMKLTLDICELDKDYYNEGKNRYKNHIKQKTIFDI